MLILLNPNNKGVLYFMENVNNIPSVQTEGSVPVLKLPVPVLKLLEKGYLYGNREVGCIVSSDKDFVSELHDLVLKLSRAIKDKDLADSKRFSAKTGALILNNGGFLAWRAAVNELNTQKKHVSDIGEKIVSLLKNSDAFDILQTQGEEPISIKNTLLTHRQDQLLKFFNEGRAQIV
jgi:hypothetical protein